jgi:F420-non-reducing hydrogenase iron-sulfur subunit
LIRLLGIEEKRLRLEWFSAAEGQRFAQVITEFVEDVKKVGPSPLRNLRSKATTVKEGVNP